MVWCAVVCQTQAVHKSCSVLHCVRVGRRTKLIMKVWSGRGPSLQARSVKLWSWKKKHSKKSTAPIIYKHNGDRELLVGADAKGRSKATSDLSVHTHTHTGTHSNSPISPTNTLANRQTHTHPQKTYSLSDTNVCLHIHTYKYKVQTSGVCCQNIIKTKSQPPLGMTEFDQSKALFRVRITFQLLKLMNSLSRLMNSSAANEVDSVFVLFTAHSKNNIVTVSSYKVEQRQGVKIGGQFSLFTVSPVLPRNSQCSGIFGSFNFCSSPSVMRNVPCGTQKNLSHMQFAASLPPQQSTWPYYRRAIKIQL